MAKSMSKTNPTSSEKPEVVKTNVENEIKETKKTVNTVTVKSKEYKDDDVIPCKSVTSGKLIFKGRTGNVYKWLNYGDIEYVSYKDLKYEVQNTSSYSQMYHPRFIVQDDEFVEKFPKLKDFYESMYTTSDFEEILNLPAEEIAVAIKELPVGCRECLKGIVSTMISDGRLDSVKRIKALDDIFGTQMLLMLATN